MHHPTSLRSRVIRSAMIPVSFLFVAASGCADQQLTEPIIDRVARSQSVPFNRFFLAWGQKYSTGPVETQLFALDTRQDRQFAPFEANPEVLAFAKAYPGQLYINGDEIDQYCLAPSEYARMYHDFVVAVRAVDPRARFSPSGFAEPNDHCCPEPITDECRWNSHSVVFADQFYNAYSTKYGVAPPVDEWRFHDFGITVGVGNVAAWWARVDFAAKWSVGHGANMVLGAWGFPGWAEPISDFREHLKQAIGLISSDSRIKGAVYWTYQPWIHSPHYLANDDGSLTAEGETFVNPLTDVPAGVTAVASSNGRAKIQWSNTTSAWGSEVEFWVQTPASGSFVYRNTERVQNPGSSESPLVIFSKGDKVKARVRYYNAFGQAQWSGFSEPLLIESGKASSSSGKSALPCFSSKRIQSQCG